MNFNTTKTTRRERKLAVAYLLGELTMSELSAKLGRVNVLSGASVVARALRDLARENESFAQALKTLENTGL